jgi:hypothetical protein
MKRAKPVRLPLLEKHVEGTITDFLLLRRWEVIATKAENLTRGGRPAHKPGTLDTVAMRWRERDGRFDVFWLESKRRGARTEPGHLLEQKLEQARLEKANFPVCRIPDGHADPFGYFHAWYLERYLFKP